MGETVSRAGFNVMHLRHGPFGTRGDRSKLMAEAMRELDPKLIEYFAERNRSIVPSESHQNIALVNDGKGGFRRVTSMKDAAAGLDYGDSRIGTRKNEMHRDLVGDNGNREWNPNNYESTGLVTHLPKGMCVEIPNYYQVYDKEGNPRYDDEGNPVKRSRWVARDRDEAIQYFMDTLEFYDTVLPGGQAGIHWCDINFDETVPHMQTLGDTLGPDPKDPDKLKCFAHEVWGSHPSQVHPDGRRISAKTKMSRYQQAYRDFMIAKGYPVEREASATKEQSLSLKEYQAVKDEEKVVDAKKQFVTEKLEEIEERETKLEERSRELDQRQADVDDLEIKYRRKLDEVDEELKKVETDRTDIRRERAEVAAERAEALRMQQVATTLQNDAQSRIEEADDYWEKSKSLLSSLQEGTVKPAAGFDVKTVKDSYANTAAARLAIRRRAQQALDSQDSGNFGRKVDNGPDLP